MATSSVSYYKMDHTCRGIAVIIDNYEFDVSEYEKLEGHILDVMNYKTAFMNLGFKENEIKLHENQTKEQMIKLMNDYALEIYTNSDCFIGVFLSHGVVVNNKQYIKSIDGSEGPTISELTDVFKYNESLYEKPKIFFFDVCRGREEEPSHSKSISNNKGNHELNVSSFVLETCSPKRRRLEEDFFSQSDFFFGWASVSGFVAKYDLKQGSWYSNVLCETLNENYLTTEFQHIMTKVNQNLKNKYKR